MSDTAPTPTLKSRVTGVLKKFKLDSHHAIERFGVLVGVFAVLGVATVVPTVASAVHNNQADLASTALYTERFTTSRTDLRGDVDGVYRNDEGDRVLVLMHFAADAAISYSADDYEAFLLGSDSTGNSSEVVSTEGVTGSFYVMGSTGYVGVVLEADEPFDRQILNLTVRANSELTYSDQMSDSEALDEVVEDASFQAHDQWRVFMNPGAEGVQVIPALNGAQFDVGRAYYDIVLTEQENEIRGELDRALVQMRTHQTQIGSYTADLATTRVDGLFLRPPAVPVELEGDEIIGQTAGEAEDNVSTLELITDEVTAGGLDFDWREGNVYDGYLDSLVPGGHSYVTYLSDLNEETTSDSSLTNQISAMEWILSDGSDLRQDYRSSDVAMRPLVTVMNNLTQAYRDYARVKSEYQTDLLFDLVTLEVQLRDVQDNHSIQTDEDFLVVYR